MTVDEEVLTGGNTSGTVVRIGATLRKPWDENTPAVHAYLRALREQDVGAPQPLGRDEEGRQVLEFVEGDSAMAHLPLNEEGLTRVGQMIRRIHDVSESVPISGSCSLRTVLPADTPNLMCHNDLAPWNLVVGERWVFIDWDGAGPSTRLWDLAYAAQAFAMLWEGEDVGVAATRLRAFVDGYEADASLRGALPAAMARRTAAMYELLRSSNETGFQPWANLFASGHGELWRTASEYVSRNQSVWKRAVALGS